MDTSRDHDAIENIGFAGIYSVAEIIVQLNKNVIFDSDFATIEINVPI